MSKLFQTRIFILSALILVFGCHQDDQETTIIAQFKKQIGYLNYSSVSFSTLQFKKDHVINEVVVCSSLPDSLKKSTKILFDANLIKFPDPIYNTCVKDFIAIDLCNNPQLTPNFTSNLHPICFTPTIPALLIKSENELNESMSLYSFTILSPVNFNTHHLVSFSAGIGTIDWEVDVQYSCDGLTNTCTLTHNIKEWGNEKVYSTGNFAYAIPKIPDGFDLQIVKTNTAMK